MGGLTRPAKPISNWIQKKKNMEIITYGQVIIPFSRRYTARFLYLQFNQ